MKYKCCCCRRCCYCFKRSTMTIHYALQTIQRSTIFTVSEMYALRSSETAALPMASSTFDMGDMHGYERYGCVWPYKKCVDDNSNERIERISAVRLVVVIVARCSVETPFSRCDEQTSERARSNPAIIRRLCMQNNKTHAPFQCASLPEWGTCDM